MKIVSIALITLFTLTGCTTNRGPRLIEQQRFNYNQKFIQSEQEQMLMNLVRLRYHETPVFLELSSIVTQYNVKNFAQAAASSGISLTADTKTSGSISPNATANFTFEEKPTVTYKPLQGEEFATRVLTPIAPSTVLLLSQSGWSISRLMQLCVQKLNNVENAVTAAGPTPKHKPEFEGFVRLVSALRHLQKNGLIHFSSPEEGKVRFQVKDIPAGRSDLKESKAIIEQALGSTSSKDGHVALKTRSLLGVFFYLSHAVTPPKSHIKKGYVTETISEDGTPFDWSELMGNLLTIRSQKSKPSDAFIQVEYKNHWFYVDNSDLNSKDTLGLLSYLFALQSADGKGQAPLLTL